MKERFRQLGKVGEAGDATESLALDGGGRDRRDAPPALLAGELLGDRFRIVRGLGQGGMAQVYEAFDQELDRSVALKLIRPELAVRPGIVERFKSEVRLAHRVTHENVCRIFDLYLHRSSRETSARGALLFLTMELIRGRTLAERLRQGGKLAPAQATWLLRQIAGGLDAAHRAGVVHGDLKPSNLMLSDEDDEPRAVITDFGLAFVLRQDEPTPSGGEVTFGTPAYMAPEYASSGRASEAADLYAFGLVAWEMLTGRRLAGAAGSREDPSDLESQLPDVPGRRLLLQCLEPLPERRPATARELAEALAGGARLRTLLAFRGRLPAGTSATDASFEHDGATLCLLDHPWQAVRLALEALRIGDRARNEASFFAVHLGESASAAGGWPVKEAAGDHLLQLLDLAESGHVLLSQSAFETARQAGSPAGERADAAATEAVASETETGLRWLAHGSYLVGGRKAPIEVFAVADGHHASAEAPAESEQARRILGHGAILGWRPGVDRALPHRPHWRIVQKLGEGGFGDVWLARHEKTGESRVLKFCYDRERLAALQREVTLFRLLRQELGERDDINRILDWNLDEEPFFIETEYSAGGDLEAWVARQGGLRSIPRRELLEMAAQTAEALAAAHSIGVLHKDIKPANVLVEERPGGARVKLADFGIGHALDRDRLDAAGITVLGLTAASTPSRSFGSRLYAAPEVLEGRLPTVQADIYALGILLYQMLAGDFSRALAPGWRRQVDDPLLAEDIAAAVDGHPEERPSAAGFARRLRRLDERRAEIESRRQLSERVERTQKELDEAKRRRRLLSSVLAAVVLVALTVTFLARKIAVEASRARDAARLAVAIDQMDENPTLAALALLEVEKPDRRARALMRQALTEPLAHRELHFSRGIGTLSINHDASLLAFNADDGVWLWPTGLDGGEEAPPRRLHDDSVLALGFDATGRYLFATNFAPQLIIWDLDGGSRREIDLPARVWRLDTDPEGRRIVAPCEDNTARIYPLRDPGEAVVLRGHRHWVLDARFSPDGESMVTASRDGTVRIWRVQDGALLHLFEDHESWVFHAEFSPDGRHVASASRDGTARIWDLRGEEPPRVLEGHEGTVSWAHFHPDGERLLTSSQDGSIRLWSIEGDLLRIVERGQGDTEAIFDPSGRFVLSDAVTGFSRLSTDSEIPALRFETPRPYGDLKVSPDGRWLATSGGASLHIWPLEPDLWGRVLFESMTRVLEIEPEPERGLVAVATSDPVIRLLDLEGRRLKELHGHEGAVAKLTFHPRGRQLASGSRDDTARLWPLDDLHGPGEIEAIAVLQHEGTVEALDYHPSGEILASGAFDGRLLLWPTDGGEGPFFDRRISSFVLGQVAFDAGGHHLLTRGAKGEVKRFAFDLEKRSVGSGASLGAPPVSHFAVDARARRLVTHTRGSGLVLFDISDPARWPAPKLRTWLYGLGTGRQAGLGPDGETFALPSGDAITLFDATADDEPIQLLGHEDQVTSVEYLPDGRLLSGSLDGTVRIWRADQDDPRTAIEKQVRICVTPEVRQELFFEAEEEALSAYNSCKERLGLPDDPR